jgi:Protein of unknown function (DUF4233)
MKILGASVLIAESITMGFAILLAMKDHSSAAIVYGCVISFLLFVAAGLVRRPGGFVIGSLMQLAMIGFGFVVPSFFIIGAVLIGLWVAAIVVGRKGEAARAALLAAEPKKP